MRDQQYRLPLKPASHETAECNPPNPQACQVSQEYIKWYGKEDRGPCQIFRPMACSTPGRPRKAPRRCAICQERSKAVAGALKEA
jgi:hypothetical protein